MKKILSLLIVVLLVSMGAYSQAPGIFNYQGVARNSVGNVLVNKTISLRLTVHDLTAAGAVVYQESRVVITNPFGLFNVQVGSPGGLNVTGTVAGVPWGVGAKFIQVEIDPNGGTTFINIGTAQIASVPYAIFSNIAGDLVLPFNKTQADAGTLFRITNSGTGAGSTALEGLTNSTAGNVNAIIGTVTSTTPGGFSTGVRGINNGAGGLGIGVYGSQNGSGWGVYGTTPSGLGVYGNTTSGTGVYGGASSGTGGFFTSTSGIALNTAGPLRHTGINEALNRILASDAAGNATWKDPAAVGIVTGSGTLNFVPKWTPSGTNLGNSNLWVDGTNFSTGINTTTMPVTNALNISGGWIQVEQGTSANFPFLHLNSTIGGGNGGIIFGSSAGGADNGRFLYRAGGDYVSISHRNGGAGTNGLADLIVKNGDIGINNIAPTAKLQIDNTGTTPTLFVNQTNAANIQRAIVAFTPNTTSIGFGNGATYAQRGAALGGTNFLFTGAPSAVIGITGGATTGIGVQGSGIDIGVIGVTNAGVGVLAYAVNAAGYGLQTNGRVQIAGQGAGLNKVLTSDATGNATWQTLGGGVGVGGSGTLNFVAKWTPNGFNLGNSQIFDNGTQVQVGTGVGNGSTLNIGASTVTPNASVSYATGAEGFNIHENASGQMNFEANNTGVGFGNIAMTIDDDNVNVGIGTTAPTATSKLEVNHASFPNTGSTIYANSNPATNGNITGVYGRGGWYGVQGVNDNTQGRGVSVGVQGIGSGSNYTNGYGVLGTSDGTGTNNYGLYGNALNGTTSNIGVYAAGTSLAALLDGVSQVGTTTSNTSTLNLGTATGVTLPSVSFNTGGGQLFNIHENAAGQLNFQANFATPGTSDVVMTIDDTQRSVGINTSAPNVGFNLHVETDAGSGTNSGIYTNGEYAGIVTQNNSAVVRSFALGMDASVSGSNFNFGYGVIANSNGVGNGFNVGLYGTASNNSASNVGVYGLMTAGGPNDYAGWFDGRVRIRDGSQGAGKVFTSDANGVGSWQASGATPDIHFTSNGGSSQVLPTTFTDINSWTGLDEAGGANYNPITGEYTIPVSGYYAVKAQIGFISTAIAANDVVEVAIRLNGSVASSLFGMTVLTSGQPYKPTITVQTEQKYVAGDKIKIATDRTGPVSLTLQPNLCAFSIHLTHL